MTVDYNDLFRTAMSGVTCVVLCCNDHCLAKERNDAVNVLVLSRERFWEWSPTFNQIKHSSGGRVVFGPQIDEVNFLRGMRPAKIVRV